MTNTPTPKTVIVYRNSIGNEPFTTWPNRLRDPTTQRRILSRLRRLEQGNYGDVKPVGAGVNELRFFLGQATAYTLAKTATRSWFCFAEVIKPASPATSNRRKPIGRSI